MVKPVGESGGYGLIIGPHATQAEIAAFRAQLAGRSRELYQSADDKPVGLADAWPVRNCAAPCRSAAVCHHRKKTWVLPGGLTRVALREGSLVVNSSQGGGSKDTWVLE